MVRREVHYVHRELEVFKIWEVEVEIERVPVGLERDIQNEGAQVCDDAQDGIAQEWLVSVRERDVVMDKIPVFGAFHTQGL